MNWPTIPLAEVAPAKPQKAQVCGGDQTVWQVTLDHIESGSGRLLQRNLRPLSEAGSSTHWFDTRHVLYSKLRPYLNKVLLPDQEGLGTTELVPLLPDEGRLDREYLAHYLRSESFVGWVSNQTAGAKMPRVAMTQFWNHEIPLPPLAEQKCIAAILDKADSLRQKRAQAIQLADEFIRSVFLDMFGDPVLNPMKWKTKPLKALCDIRGGGTPSKSVASYWNGDIPWVSPKDMGQDTIIDSQDRITKTAVKESSTQLIEPGSILMVVRSGVLKHRLPLAMNLRTVALNQDMKAFVPGCEVEPSFLLYALKAGSRHLLSTVRATTADNLSSDVVHGYSMILPELSLQKKFSLVVQHYAQLRKSLRKSTPDFDDAFKSLSQSAFEGKLENLRGPSASFLER